MFNVTTQKPAQRMPGSGAGINYANEQSINPVQNVFGLYRKVNARGTLTLGAQPANAETFTIGTKVYTFQTTLTNADGNIKIGSTLAETQTNVNAAINLTGTPGVQYALATRVNTQVDIGTFGALVANQAIIKAKIAGTAGNSIATTETMASGSNVFDAVTLGTYVAGADYTFPEISFRPTTTFTYHGNSAGSVVSALAIGNNIDTYGISRAPMFQWKWAANSMKKIHIPNFFDKKIQTVPVLGFGLAAQLAQDLATTTGHVNNVIQSIIEVGTNKGVAHYANGTDSRMYVVCFTVDATTGALTVGTPVIVSASASLGEDDNTICKIDTDKFLVGFDDSTATNFPKCAVGTISGTVITMAGGVQPVATATTEIKLIPLNTDKALLVFNATSLYVVSIAVTIPSYGPLSTLTSATAITACQNGNDKFQLAYSFSSANYTMACTVSSTTITQGTALRVTVGNFAGGHRQHALVQLSADKILYLTDQAESYRNISENCYYLTVSGTVTTVTDSTYKGYTEDSNVQAILIESNRVMFAQNYHTVGYITVDTTNGLILPEQTQCAVTNHFLRTDNNIGNAYAFTSANGVGRFAKIGSWVIAMAKQPDFNNKIGYWSFPINQSIEVYKDDEFVKSVAFKYPMSYFPIPLVLDIDDYEVHIKFKNPKNQLMYLIPYRDGYASSVIYD